MIKQAGFSLIELVIFIVILATGVGVLIPLITTTRYVRNIDQQTEAIALAQQRMELILAQEHLKGFSSFTDPCSGGSPPPACTPPSGYIVSANIGDNWEGNSDYKVIAVDVSGKATANLKTLVANYQS
jgi:type II secretory pathway pseudopilin PulG